METEDRKKKKIDWKDAPKLYKQGGKVRDWLIDSWSTDRFELYGEDGKLVMGPCGIDECNELYPEEMQKYWFKRCKITAVIKGKDNILYRIYLIDEKEAGEIRKSGDITKMPTVVEIDKKNSANK